MLKIKQLSAAGLVHYHGKHLKNEQLDYYGQHETVTATWQGGLAARLGLEGAEVTPFNLACIANNIDPRKARPCILERLAEVAKPLPPLDLSKLQVGDRVRVEREACATKVLALDLSRGLAVLRQGKRRRTVPVAKLLPPPRKLQTFPEERITPRARPKAAYDVTASFFKTASLAALLRPELLDDHEVALKETLAEMAHYAGTRVRLGTGNNQMDGSRAAAAEFLTSSFLHRDSRPEIDSNGNVVVGPHTHTHLLIHNIAWDPVENRFKALDFAQVVAMVEMFQGIYESKLAHLFRARGFEVLRSGYSFEIKGISQELIRLASPRTERIEQLIRDKKITSEKAKREVAGTNRAPKAPGINILQTIKKHVGPRLWREVEETNARATAPLPTASPQERTRVAKNAIDRALARHLERAPRMKIHQVLADALKFAGHIVTYDELKIDLAHRTDLYIARDVKSGLLEVTTEKAVIRERLIAKLYREGVGRKAPLLSAAKLPKALSKTQKTALTHILSSTDWITALVGQAGTGKSRTLKELFNLLENENLNAVVLAQTRTASRGEARREGLKDADTIARFLGSSRQGRALRAKARNSLIIVDEAGLVDIQTGLKLFQQAKELQARLLLVGDERQLGPVGAGHLLHTLKKAGLQSAELTEIHRQKTDADKAWVRTLREDAPTALASAREDGRIIELDVPEGEHPTEVAAAKAAELLLEARQRGLSTLSVCPTHAMGEALSEAVRRELQAAGLVQADAVSVTVRRAKDELEADRGDLSLLNHGDIAVFQRDCSKSGLKEGQECLAVTDRSGVTHLHYPTAGGAIGQRLPADINPYNYRVYTKAEIQLAVGDTIRTRAPIADTELQGGHIADITAISATNRTLTLSTGETISLDTQQVDYGYYVTFYGAQGVSRDYVQLVAPSTALGAVHQEGLYVGGSRFRQEIDIVTDDFAALTEQATRSSLLPGAEELARKAYGQNISLAAELGVEIDPGRAKASTEPKPSKKKRKVREVEGGVDLSKD